MRMDHRQGLDDAGIGQATAHPYDQTEKHFIGYGNKQGGG